MNIVIKTAFAVAIAGSAFMAQANGFQRVVTETVTTTTTSYRSAPAVAYTRVAVPVYTHSTVPVYVQAPTNVVVMPAYRYSNVHYFNVH